jgi:hypothetical protein
MEDWNQRHILVSTLVIQSMAHSVYEDFSKGDDNVKPFSASTGWFSWFTREIIFKTLKCQGKLLQLTLWLSCTM